MARGTAVAAALLVVACSARGPDVIYLPSAADVVSRMLEVARVGPADVVFDLGCGDGRIAIAAARDRGARSVCVEIDPSLVARSRRNADTAGVVERIEFRRADMFETDLRSATVVALYLSPALNVRLRPKLFREVRPGARIVSHNFGMDDWTADTVLRVAWPTGTTSTVQVWVLPADVAGTWELALPAAGEERRFRLRFTQRYQEVSGTASEGGRTVALEGARLAGDSLEFRLVTRDGEEGALHFAGRVSGGEMAGSVRTRAGGGGTRWRAVRPGDER